LLKSTLLFYEQGKGFYPHDGRQTWHQKPWGTGKIFERIRTDRFEAGEQQMPLLPIGIFTTQKTTGEQLYSIDMKISQQAPKRGQASVAVLKCQIW
jgi:hypothetical protein